MISLSALANQIFERYVDWDAFADRYGYVNMRKETFRALVDSTDEKLLVKNAQLAGRQVRDFLLFKYKRIGLRELLDFLDLQGRYGGIGRLARTQSGSQYTLVYHHDMGRRVSLLIEALTKSAIASVNNLRPKSEISDNSVVMEFEASQ